jgi:hypothetical protein
MEQIRDAYQARRPGVHVGSKISKMLRGLGLEARKRGLTEAYVDRAVEEYRHGRR